MSRAFSVLCAIILALFAPRAYADIAAIQADKLPQETAVLAALEDARQMEPYSQSFTPDWKYPVAKDTVAAHLAKDMSTLLRAASLAHAGNPELLLLTGLVAHYAYNVDVDGSHGAAMDALAQAEKLAPADFRAPWFRASLECQTRELKPGAEEFLAIESHHSFDQLPAAFWDDYMACAWLVGMPAHVLRAADHLQILHAGESHMRTFLSDVAQKRFDAFDPNRNYEPKDVWNAEQQDGEVVFTSTMCGVRLRARADWRVNRAEWNNGNCLAYFSTGPYQATTKQLRPSVLLMVQRPKEGETLEGYARKFMKDGPLTPYTPSHCPVETCLAYKQDASGMYGADGNGHGRLVVFERDEPKYPGLLFESPWELPNPKGDAPEVFHPMQVQKRIPGKLFYLVLLDAAASIEEPAMKDFDFFLQNLTVE